MAYGSYSPKVGKMVKSDGSIIDIAEAFNTLRKSFIVMSDYEQKLLEGRAFHALIETTVSASGSAAFSLITGANSVIANIQTLTLDNGILEMDFFEDADVSGGTAIDILNRDRTSSNASSVSIYNAPTIADEGLLMDKVGTGESGIGSSITTTVLDAQLPWRLKPNTNYLTKLVNSGSSDIDVIVRILIIEE